MDPKKPRRVSDPGLGNLKDAVRAGRFETAPQVRIKDQDVLVDQDVLADLMH